jgi:hypothetical protein
MPIGIPPEPPRWAYGSSADITEPASGKKDTGWEGGSTPDRPPAQNFNWFWKSIWEQVDWLLSNFYRLYPGHHWRDPDDIGINVKVQVDLSYAPWDDKFVIVGSTWGGGPGFICSALSSGDVWTVEQSSLSGNLFGIAHNGSNLWAAFGDDGAAGEIHMWTASTADGTWTDRTAVHAAANIGLGRAGIYDSYNSRWHFGHLDGDQIAYTSDPTSVAVTKVTATGASGGIRALAADGSGVVLAFGDSGISRSTNGGTSWASAAGGVTDDSGSQRAAVWDSINSRFLYGARRSSDDQLVVCQSPTGADGTWTVHELSAVPTHVDCQIDSIVVGSRGEIYVSGTTGDKGPFLAGTVDLYAWHLLSQRDPRFTTVDYQRIAQQDGGGSRKNHFLVGAVSNNSITDGLVAARTDPNVF